MHLTTTLYASRNKGALLQGVVLHHFITCPSVLQLKRQANRFIRRASCTPLWPLFRPAPPRSSSYSTLSADARALHPFIQEEVKDCTGPFLHARSRLVSYPFFPPLPLLTFSPFPLSFLPLPLSTLPLFRSVSYPWFFHLDSALQSFLPRLASFSLTSNSHRGSLQRSVPSPSALLPLFLLANSFPFRPRFLGFWSSYVRPPLSTAAVADLGPDSVSNSSDTGR